jgi:uncharacterized protein (UPF0332 family)
VTGENRLANAIAEVSAAHDALRVAEAALGLGIRRDAMSRTYYAAFHAARALLLLEGLEPKTHAGILRMLGEHLLRAGKLDAASMALITRLQAYRQASDYAYAFDIEGVDAVNELASARAFVDRAAQAVAVAQTSRTP